MKFVIGRGEETEIGEQPAGELGAFRALDGSEGAPLYFDMDGPHAMLIVGKRGYGKSFTLGVIAEELARTREVSPVIVDPMGVFDTLAEPADGSPVPTTVVREPAVTPNSLDPRSWCALLGLSPESGAGGLLWKAAQDESTIEGMKTNVEETDAPGTDKRAAVNHIRLAESWGVFDADGLDAQKLAGNEISVLDVSGLDDAPMNAVARGVGEALYRARVREDVKRLPWLMMDEAHTFFQGVAKSALHLILTRGRAPGVSLVLATQRPSAISEVGISQSDIVISHRLTSHDDVEALKEAQPTYMKSSIDERMPTDPGEVVIIDDSTEEVQAAQIRWRDTPHGGDSPSASDIEFADEPSEMAQPDVQDQGENDVISD